jgi:hypothetical protein
VEEDGDAIIVCDTENGAMGVDLPTEQAVAAIYEIEGSDFKAETGLFGITKICH